MRYLGLAAVALVLALGIAAGSASPAGSAQERLPDLRPVPRYLFERDIIVSGGQRLLRFSNGVGNFGHGPVEVRGTRASPTEPMTALQRIYLAGGGSFEAPAGEFTYDFSHNHWHFDDFVHYDLLNLDGSPAGTTVKAGFCLLDVERTAFPLPLSPTSPVYVFCNQGGSNALSIGPQGLSRGWIDVYSLFVEGQSINITGLASGWYILRATVDPLDRIQESDETNNTAAVPVFIP